MSKKILEVSKAPTPIGPYSQAVEANGMLFISGQIAIDASTGELILNSIEEETEMVMKNIGFILNEANMEFENIVKCSIFISDMNNFKIINEVYAKYFPNNFPARETVEVSCLPKSVNVEISCVAIK